MSKSTLRKDKTCLNCRHVVDQRFCPNCGQENTESRKTFHHLFVHFFEDLTHYENAFWRTIRNLLFKPSALTKEYLSGKRLSYLAPVRLYIFISFITFFFITVIPDSEDHLLKANQTQTVQVVGKDGKLRDSVISNKKVKISEVLEQADALEKDSTVTKTETTNYVFKDPKDQSDFFKFGYKSVAQLDSLYKYAQPAKKPGDFEYWIIRKCLQVKQHNSNAEIFEKFKESFIHNFPKVLFVYMPLFAFFLWLFHIKKRWYYFDHGIFTLHYFSFLLLMLLLLFLIDWLLTMPDIGVLNTLTILIHFVGLSWMFYYFFPAHHRFYGETRIISFLKSIVLFVINCVLILLILSLFAVYTFINLH